MNDDWEAMDPAMSQWADTMFVDVDLIDWDDHGDVFSGCNFRNVRFNVSRHTDAAFVNCTFTGCSFFDATFTRCKLVGSRFERCTFTLLKVTAATGPSRRSRAPT